MALKSKYFNASKEKARLNAAAAPGGAVLRLHDHGEAVRAIHDALATMADFAVGDGDYNAKYFGVDTESCVAGFKTFHDPPILAPGQVKADGIVGPGTLAALDRNVIYFETQGWEFPIERKSKGKASPAPSPGPAPAPPKKPDTGWNWSVVGSSGFSNNPVPFIPAQVQINRFWFRNDDTGTVKCYIAPMFGVGMSVSLLDAANRILANIKAAWLAQLLKSEDMGPFLAEASKLLLRPNAAPAFFKLLFETFVGGAWAALPATTMTKADVLYPLGFNRLNGATIATASFSAGLRSLTANIFVYGTDWYNKSQPGTHDFLSVSSNEWGTQFQMPQLGAAVVGGPLLLAA